MSRASGKSNRETAIKRVEAATPSQAEFDEVLALIDAAKARAAVAVNTTLVDLYWQLGEYISHKVAAATWGQRTVAALAEYLQRRHPGRSGFSASNLWRMRQFFETYLRRAKTRSAVARIVMEPQPGHHESMQVRRGAGILSPPRHPGTLAIPGTGAASSPVPCSSASSSLR